MLITNFASGELSETLFGRTDLPQYFSGVSRLENFDVIPTGGIRRRNGTKRVKTMEREGRIIPFIIDRENSLLLYLLPELRDGEGAVTGPAKIEIYKNGEMISYVEDTFKITEAVVSSGGAGYAAGDLLSIGSGSAEISVLEVDEEGAVQSLVVVNPGSYLSDISGAHDLLGGNGSGAAADIRAQKTAPLYRELAEINQVQYAQNFNIMILAHENYAPLEVRITAEKDEYGAVSYLFQCDIFAVSFFMQVVASDEVNKQEFERSDPLYVDNEYLQTQGNYPKTVTFLNNRVIFGGTRNSPQRIFASRAGDLHDFSTHKIFVTRIRDYIVIQGKIEIPEGSITVTNPNDLIKFDKPLQNYFIESNFYEEGASIADLSGAGIITLSKELKTILIDDTAMTEFMDWKAAVEQNAGWSREYVIKSVRDFVPIKFFYFDYKLAYGTGKNVGKLRFFSVSLLGNKILTDATLEIEIDHAQDCVTDSKKLYKYVLSLFNLGNEYENGEYAAFITDLFDYIRIKNINDDNVMAYRLTSGGNLRVYYGSPLQILQQFNGTVSIASELETYLSFYTKEDQIDEYPTPDDGFTFEIASDMSDAIKWIGQNKNLLIGTETAEWVVPAGMNATNVQAILNSRYGSDGIQGTSVGDAFFFFQTGGKALVEYYVPQQDNNFRANNMAMLNSAMLHESRAFDFDFVSAPYTRLFVSRDDGIVVSLLYERSTGTFAWGRIITGGRMPGPEGLDDRDRVRSVATMPGPDGYDEAYLIVERGGTFFMERLDERKWYAGDASGRYYLDSNEPWTGEETQKAAYSAGAVVYDESADRVYSPAEAPAPGSFSPPHRMFVGYPFTSRVKSMPVLANDRMKQNNIKALKARFRSSFMPRVRSEPNGIENTIPFRGKPGEGFSGVVNIPFPGVYERDVFFEFVFSEPRRCEILAVNAEVN